MRSITTKYLAPTNTQGSRIKAIGGGSSVTIAYDYGLDDEELHATALLKLNEKLNWKGTLICGSTDVGYVWVFNSGYSLKL